MQPLKECRICQGLYLQRGERMITKPIGYKKKVVLSRKGSTAAIQTKEYPMNFLLIKIFK